MSNESQSVSRRNFVVGGAAAVALGAAAGTVAQGFGARAAQAAAPSNASDAATDGEGLYPNDVDKDAYFTKPAAIADVAETYDYDVVVIGAGASGVPCACAAADNGAKVVVLQKSPRVYSHGVLFSGWNAPTLVQQKGSEVSDEDIAAMKEEFMELNHYGVQPGLLNKVFAEVPEAMEWQYNELTGIGQQVMFMGAKSDDPKAFNYMVPAQVSRAYASIADDYADKVDFRFSTPAVQLVQNDSGAVTGAIAQDSDGNYLQFNAAKGVVIATGGYGGNAELIARWMPAATTFPNGCYPEDNTGDGAMMAIWAGAAVAPLKSKKIDIRFYGTHSARTDIEKQPFLMVNDAGVRIGNEGATEMEQNNFVARNPSESGTYYCIFDANYGDWLSSIGQDSAILDDEKIAEYEGGTMPLLWEAGSIEELAGKIGVDAEALAATVARYNELADAGADADFYKDAKDLYRIDTAPYYAMVRQYTIGGTLGAIKVTDDCQAVSRTTGEGIEGLYVIGNDMGGLQTGQDYVWHDYGFTLTSACALGYAVGRDLAKA
ncbi:MAG: FAD-binding protein [Coriobacteriales bacterium]|jgi:fumarate reductase flavoprotein subunit